MRQMQTNMTAVRRWAIFGAMSLATAGAGLMAGCDRNDMRNDAQLKPYEASPFFVDGMSSRPLVEGTVPTVMGETQALQVPNQPELMDANTFPFQITRADLNRGQERYNIYCAPCHGAIGDGDGMIVRRGFVPPPSLHIERLRQAPARHYYDVMTNGFGAMYSYADRVGVEDRWRITAYIRALQLSQNVDPALLSEAERQKLDNPLAAQVPPASETTTHE